MAQSPSAQVPSLTSEYLTANQLAINPKKLDMATSEVALRETGDFYALQCRTENETLVYSCTLIQVQPMKTRMCHMTRTQAISISK